MRTLDSSQTELLSKKAKVKLLMQLQETELKMNEFI